MFKATVFAAAVALATVGLPASAAAAAEPAGPAGCPSGYFCVWSEPNFSGRVWMFRQPVNDANYADNGITQVGSVFNNGITCAGCEDVLVYERPNYTGRSTCVRRGTAVNPPIGGQVSSHRWTDC